MRKPAPSGASAQPELRRIPVVVLTTSQAEHDILTGYDLHANCYIRKRMDLDELLAALKSAR